MKVSLWRSAPGSFPPKTRACSTVLTVIKDQSFADDVGIEEEMLPALAAGPKCIHNGCHLSIDLGGYPHPSLHVEA